MADGVVVRRHEGTVAISSVVRLSTLHCPKQCHDSHLRCHGILTPRLGWDRKWNRFTPPLEAESQDAPSPEGSVACFCVPR
jgi:hypothetical protein